MIPMAVPRENEMRMHLHVHKINATVVKNNDLSFAFNDLCKTTDLSLIPRKVQHALSIMDDAESGSSDNLCKAK